MNTLLPDSAVARVMTATASYINPEGRAISSPPAVAWKTSVDIGRCRTTLRHAEPPILLGYIASKVTINGEGVAGRRVVLLGRDLAILPVRSPAADQPLPGHGTGYVRVLLRPGRR